MVVCKPKKKAAKENGEGKDIERNDDFSQSVDLLALGRTIRRQDNIMNSEDITAFTSGMKLGTIDFKPLLESARDKNEIKENRRMYTTILGLSVMVNQSNKLARENVATVEQCSMELRDFKKTKKGIFELARKCNVLTSSVSDAMDQMLSVQDAPFVGGVSFGGLLRSFQQRNSDVVTKTTSAAANVWKTFIHSTRRATDKNRKRRSGQQCLSLEEIGHFEDVLEEEGDGDSDGGQGEEALADEEEGDGVGEDPENLLALMAGTRGSEINTEGEAY